MEITDKKRRSLKALTLVEVMIAIAIIAIVALGCLGYEYHAVWHANIAKAEMTAIRTAQMLIEDWKSAGGQDTTGPNAYSPDNFDSSFTSVDDGWSVTVDNLPMFITFDWSDITTDSISNVTLREITVTIRWRHDFTVGNTREDDPSAVFTTYVRRDGGTG